MSKKSKYKNYRFINNETDNIIYLLTIPADKHDIRETLENTRHQLAVENGIYIDSIYYIEIPENELHSQ
jgi:hypothetical protein